MKSNLFKYAILILPVLCLLAIGCGKKYHLQEEKSSIESPWPFFRGRVEADGVGLGGEFSGKLDIIWEKSSSDKPGGPLTLHFGQLVYPGTKRKIKFYETINGNYKGRLKAKGIPQTGLTVYKEFGFYSTAPTKNRLKCINLKQGGTVWQRRLKDALSGSIILGDRLIMGSANGEVLAYAVADGTLLWRYDCESRLTAPPSLGHGKLFQPCDDGSLHVISPEDGERLFVVLLGGPLMGAAAIDELVYVADMYGTAFGISPDDGSIVWRRDLQDPVWSSPAVADDRIFIGHSSGKLSALRASDGKLLWQFDAKEVIRSSPIIMGSVVVVGGMSGSLFSLRVEDGRLIQKRELNGAIVQSPVTDGRRVFVATEKGSIVCLGEKNAPYSKVSE